MSPRRARLLYGGIVFVVLGLLEPGQSAADVFRFEDDAGVVHYTNVPSDPRYRRIPGWADPLPVPRVPAPARAQVDYDEAIRSVAARHGLDWRLVEAVIRVESGFNPRAISPKGAMGLMQLMPHRAAELGVRNPFDPLQNLEGGVRHLRDLLQRFAGDVTLALAAYNAGEEAVRAFGGVPPYRETRVYVRKIRALYGNGRAGDTLPPARPVVEAVYEQLADDGSVVYTNLPPAPTLLLQPRF
jgi:soluble lytic murein transglycosylase